MEMGEPGAGGHIAANLIGDDDVVVVVVVIVVDILTVFLIALKHQKWFNLNNKCRNNLLPPSLIK